MVQSDLSSVSINDIVQELERREKVHKINVSLTMRYEVSSHYEDDGDREDHFMNEDLDEEDYIKGRGPVTIIVIDGEI